MPYYAPRIRRASTKQEMQPLLDRFMASNSTGTNQAPVLTPFSNQVSKSSLPEQFQQGQVPLPAFMAATSSSNNQIPVVQPIISQISQPFPEQFLPAAAPPKKTRAPRRSKEQMAWDKKLQDTIRAEKKATRLEKHLGKTKGVAAGHNKNLMAEIQTLRQTAEHNRQTLGDRPL